MLGFPKLWKELLRLDINYIYFEDCNDQVKGRGSQMDGKKHQSNHHFEGWSSLIPKHDVGSTHPICPRCRTMCFTIFNCRWAIRAPWEDRCQGSHMDILSLAVTKWCWQHWHNHVQPSPHVHNDTMCFWIFSPTTAGCARVCGIVGHRSHALQGMVD